MTEKLAELFAEKEKKQVRQPAKPAKKRATA